MELIDVQLNTGTRTGEDKKTFEISYRNAPGEKIAMMAIDFDSTDGQKIARVSAELQRGTVTVDEFSNVIFEVVGANSGAGVSMVLEELERKGEAAISSRIKIVDNLYITVDGKEVSGPLSAQILKMARAKMKDENLVKTEDWLSLINFTELLFDNVNPHVREQLYDWLIYQVRNGRLTLTPEGKFLGYKGVMRNGEDIVSIHSGPGIVNGTPMNGNLPNNPGNVLEMARDAVDDNPNVTCSSGLHVGSYDYAKMFGHGCVILVEVDPRDVISVPYDYNGQKIRACKYKVIKEVDNELTEFSVDFTSKKQETIPALPQTDEGPSPWVCTQGNFGEDEASDDDTYNKEEVTEEIQDTLTQAMIDNSKLKVDLAGKVVSAYVDSFNAVTGEINFNVDGEIEVWYVDEIDIIAEDETEVWVVDEVVDNSEVYDKLLSALIDDVSVKVLIDDEVLTVKVEAINDKTVTLSDHGVILLSAIEVLDNDEIEEDDNELNVDNLVTLQTALFNDTIVDFEYDEIFYLDAKVQSYSEQSGTFSIEGTDVEFKINKAKFF